MAWNTRIDPEFPYIETCYEGVLTKEDLSNAIRETLELVHSTGKTLLLGDCTRLEGGHSILDLYALADALMASGEGRFLKEAVLLPELPKPVENVGFWETVCCNRGINVRIFTDRQSALDWLLGHEIS